MNCLLFLLIASGLILIWIIGYLLWTGHEESKTIEDAKKFEHDTYQGFLCKVCFKEIDGKRTGYMRKCFICKALNDL